MIKKIIHTIKVLYSYAFKASLLYMVYSILAALLIPLNVIIIEKIISNVEAYGRYSIFNKNIILWIILFVLSSMMLVWQDHKQRLLEVLIEQKLVKNCTPVIIDKYNMIDFKYFEDSNSRDIMVRMGDSPVNAIFNAFKNCIQMISTTIKIFGIALVYTKVSVTLALLLFCVIIVQIYLGFCAQKEANKLYSLQTKEERKLNYIGDLICNKDVVYDLKLNNAINYMQAIQREKASKILKDRILITLKSQRYYCLNLVLLVIWAIFMNLYMLQQAAMGNISVSLLITLMGYFPAIVNYTNTLSYYTSVMGETLLVIDAYDAFMQLPEIKNIKEETTDSTAWDKPVIAFNHVSFTYPNTDIVVLKDINFVLQPGEKVALVGRNGSGKSTLVKLLCGIYQTTSGSITINGININNILPEVRNRIITVAFQDYQKYALTVRDNVALGNTTLSGDEQKLYEALNTVALDSVVDSLPNKLETNLDHIEENGVSLSGGEWQRLAIARACLSSDKFIILDEPTASMDPMTESKLYDCFVNILSSQGCLLISHRLASAKMADTIIVLHNGSIIEAGNHYKLMEDNGFYKKMFEDQAQWYQKGVEQ